MKKLVVYILTILFLLGLTACNAKVPANNAVNTSDTSQTNATDAKVFSYLPAYSKMEFQSVTQPDGNQKITAKYLIKNTTTEKFLNDYADALKKDGWTENWTYTKDKKPASIVAQKDTHTVALLPRQVDSNVLLIISGSK